jgi:hypothetical protein
VSAVIDRTVVPVARLTRREQMFRCEPFSAVITVKTCLARQGAGRLLSPTRVHDAQVVALERERERLEEAADRRPFVVGREAGAERPRVALVLPMVGVAPAKPPIALFVVPRQQVQLVVAEDRLGESSFRQPLDELHHRHAVGPPVDQVADEHQRTRGGAPLGVDAEPMEQREQGFDFAVDVADDVDGAGREGLDQAGHGRE